MIERLLANSILYEFVQEVTGSRISEARIREIVGPIESGTRILDAGGGTGIVARAFGIGLDYCCMDLDMARLRVARRRGASAVQGDATLMPLSSRSIDLVVLRSMSHHLDDVGFAKMVAECWRVIKPGGRLLFLDAVWAPSWLVGRFMWRIDQGSHPRTEERMRAVLETHFEIERRVGYPILHQYFLALALPKAEVPMPSLTAPGERE
jgi:ubiquinone/menaquinone biosynthesis C-methylase UbiE